MQHKNYTTQLSQGAGLINETLVLLSVYQRGMTERELLNYVRENDSLACKTELRLKKIVIDAFSPRFMRQNPNLPSWLKKCRERGLSLMDFKQLLMVYCAREHAVFFDAVTKYLNPARSEGREYFDKSTLVRFMNELVSSGAASWSEGLQIKNASYVRATMIDFDMISRKDEVLPYEPADFTVLYLMYEAHLAGMSDMAIWEMEEWSLFNMSRSQVLERIMSLSLKGAYMAQTSGELLNISWNYKTMEELIDAAI